MAIVLSISLNQEEYDYLKLNRISPSELMKSAIAKHKDEEIYVQADLLRQIEKKNKAIMSLNAEIQKISENIGNNIP